MEKYLTFITPTKNPKIKDIKKLKEDLKNLQKIIFPKLIQWIIIDYKSKVNKLDYLYNLKKNINLNLKIYSIKKPGIYLAYNYGFKKSSGKWNIFIGSDDRVLFDNFLSEIELLDKYNDIDIISLPSIRILKNKKVNLIPSKILLLFKNSIPHPSTFINSNIKLIKGSNLYPTNYKIAGDYYFFLDSYLSKDIKIKSFKKSNPLVLHYSEGISNDKILSKKELLSIQNQLLGISPYLLIIFCRNIYNFMKFILHQNK